MSCSRPSTCRCPTSGACGATRPRHGTIMSMAANAWRWSAISTMAAVTLVGCRVFGRLHPGLGHGLDRVDPGLLLPGRRGGPAPSAVQRAGVRPGGGGLGQEEAHQMPDRSIHQAGALGVAAHSVLSVAHLQHPHATSTVALPRRSRRTRPSRSSLASAFARGACPAPAYSPHIYAAARPPRRHLRSLGPVVPGVCRGRRRAGAASSEPKGG